MNYNILQRHAMTENWNRLNPQLISLTAEPEPGKLQTKSGFRSEQQATLSAMKCHSELLVAKLARHDQPPSHQISHHWNSGDDRYKKGPEKHTTWRQLWSRCQKEHGGKTIMTISAAIDPITALHYPLGIEPPPAETTTNGIVTLLRMNKDNCNTLQPPVITRHNISQPA